MNNFIQEGKYLNVACSSPATPTSGGPVRVGFLTGVAVTDEGDGGNLSTETTVKFDGGVYDLSVAAVNDSGNSDIAKFDALYYVDADTPHLSKKSSGYFFGYALEASAPGDGSAATINVLHVSSPGSGSIANGGVTGPKLANDAVETDKILDHNVTGPKLTATMATGFIPLDFTTARIISTNAIQNTTEGGIPDGNTAPLLERVNGATDKALRLKWAASASGEIQFAPVPKPPDLDGAAALTVHLMLAKDTNTDNTVTVDVQVFDGVGDTECGAATAVLDAATLAEYSASVSASDLAEHPGFLNICLIPGTHTTDAIYLYAAWAEYTRK